MTVSSSSISILPTSFTLNTGIGAPVAIESIPSNMVAYLLQYGMSKSLQDAASGTKAKAEAAYLRARGSSDTDKEFESFCEAASLDLDSAFAMNREEFASTVVNAQKSARLAAILAGTVGASRAVAGPKASDALGREMTKVGAERLKAAAKAQGKTLPKGADFAAMLAGFVTKYDESIREEATRRLAVANSASLDLAELLGDLPI